MYIKNEAILITAGTRRLGFLFAKTALENGYSVILHYRTSNDEALSWLRAHPEYAERTFFLQHDLQNNPAIIIEMACTYGVPLVGLINNASLYSMGNINDYSHFNELLSIHLLIPLELGTRFSAVPSAQWIINITDAKIHAPNLRFQNYRMSKIFLEELTRQQAVLYAPGIRVNAIAPGAMLPAKSETTQTFSDLQRTIPLQKTGDLAALARTLQFLIGDTYITGEILRVDGGWHLTG